MRKNPLLGNLRQQSKNEMRKSLRIPLGDFSGCTLIRGYWIHKLLSLLNQKRRGPSVILRMPLRRRQSFETIHFAHCGIFTMYQFWPPSETRTVILVIASTWTPVVCCQAANVVPLSPKLYSPAAI